MRKESDPAATSTAATAAGADSVDLGESGYDSARTVGIVDVADQQCDRRVD